MGTWVRKRVGGRLEAEQYPKMSKISQNEHQIVKSANRLLGVSNRVFFCTRCEHFARGSRSYRNVLKRAGIGGNQARHVYIMAIKRLTRTICAIIRYASIMIGLRNKRGRRRKRRRRRRRNTKRRRRRRRRRKTKKNTSRKRTEKKKRGKRKEKNRGENR